MSAIRDDSVSATSNQRAKFDLIGLSCEDVEIA